MANSQQKFRQDNLQKTSENSENLSFDESKQSYELDVKGRDKDYDHPMGYNTVATGAIDDDSTYDEANPYVGDEYGKDEDIISDELDGLGIHIDYGEGIKLNAEDEILGRTPEDSRDDLDEEGYPVNDRPLK